MAVGVDFAPPRTVEHVRAERSPRALDLRDRAATLRRTPTGARGLSPGLLSLADPALRDGLERIFGDYVPPEDPAAYEEVLSRDEALARWITEPLRNPALV